MKRPFSQSSAASIVAVLIALLAVSAHAQFQAGNIYGKVEAKDGSMLPGVTVTLTGVGAPQTFVTDSSGNFRFLNLSPGIYNLSAELAGMGTAVRSNIRVSIGQNADITLVIAPSVRESITVTAEAPLVDTRKTGTGATITHAELEQLPTGRDPFVIMGLAPGVQLDRVNVGGSESGQQDIVVARGASDTQKTFNVDGVNITDVGSIGSTPTYYDFDSFEEIQVTTGGSDPRIQTPGAQLNMVTKRGTNEFKGNARYFLADHDWQASTKPSGEAARYLENGNSINRNTNVAGDVGGPILRDKLWFWGAYAKQDIKLFVGQPIRTPVNPDNTILKDYNGKINLQLLKNNSGTYFYTYGDKLKFGRYADAQHPPDATVNQSGPTHMYKLEDTQIFNQNFYLTLLYSHVLSPFAFVPSNAANGVHQPYIDENGVYHRGYFLYSTERPQDSYRGDSSYFFKTGKLDHELKFGFGYRKAPVTSISTYPTTNVLGDFSQGSGKAGEGIALLTRSGKNDYVVKYNDAYVGDTLTLGNLTLQAGLRYDNQTGRNAALTFEANPLAPDILKTVVLPGDTRDLKWDSVSPRLGATYKLGDKTLLRGSYNRYVNQLGGDVMSAGNSFSYSAGLYFYWTDKNGDKTVQRSEIDFASGIYGTYGNIDPDNPNPTAKSARFDYNMKPPKTDEFIAGVEQQLFGDLSIGADYSYRKFTDFWWQVHEKHQGQGDYLGPADFDCTSPSTHVTGALPNGQSVTVVNCKQLTPAPFTVITNRPDYNQTYNGFDIYATKRMSNRWMGRASFTWNDRKQHITSDRGIEDPTHLLQPPNLIPNSWFGCTSCDGSIALDKSYGTHTNTYINARWQYSLTGLLQLPWTTTLGANLTGREGYPVPYYYRISGRRVLMEDLGSTRNPNMMELDMRLGKDFKFGPVGFQLAAEGFNITNNRTVLQRNNRIYRSLNTKNAAGNSIEEIMSPRIFRLAAKLSF
ncbi:MAG TPA: TonB-dependent receptor [Thermoanaerobaculia bacterium]